MITTEWFNDDPREHYPFRKRFNVIVTDGKTVVGAFVDIKNEWYVSFGDAICGRTLLQERDKWPKELFWCDYPELKKTGSDEQGTR